MCFLKRQEAVKLLKEIFDKCSGIDGQFIALIKPNAADLLSHGYQVHIKTNMDSSNKVCLQEMVDKHNLALNTTGDTAIIYKPSLGNDKNSSLLGKSNMKNKQ